MKEQLNLPDLSNRSAGLLQRDKSAFNACYGDGDIPTIADKGIKLIPRTRWVNKIGVGEHVWWMYDQLDGMCASNGAAQCMMVLRNQARLPKIALSPEELYRHVGRWGTGSTLQENIRMLMREGIATRATMKRMWPYTRQDIPSDLDEERKQFILLEAFDLGGSFEALVTALHKRMVCYIGLDWPRLGPHAVCCTDWVDGHIEGPNSWMKKEGPRDGKTGWYSLSEKTYKRARPTVFGSYAFRVITEADNDPQPPTPGV